MKLLKRVLLILCHAIVYVVLKQKQSNIKRDLSGLRQAAEITSQVSGEEHNVI